MDNNNESKPKKRQSSRKKRKNSSLDGKENTPKTKKIKVKRCCSADGIGISKQLAMKKQKTTVRKRRSNNETKMCPNGKPMPSLADLEKMFEDTDTEDQSTPKPEPEAPKTPMKNPVKATDNQLLSPSTVSKIAERMMEIISNTEPTALFAQIPLSPDEPRLPVVPPKKRKKSDIPYIVGCKERPQVPYKPCTSFCKGDDDYGVDNHTDEEDQFPNKRRKKSNIGGFSKSIFNALSDDIAENLKKIGEGDKSGDSSKTEDCAYIPFIPLNTVTEPLKSTENHSDDSFDSSKTVDYFDAEKVSANLKISQTNIHSKGNHHNNKIVDCNASLTANGKPVGFSPLPSTSRDNETFIKNDILFNESLTSTNAIHTTEETERDELSFENYELSNENLPASSTINDLTDEQTDNDVQIVEIPCETIVVNDNVNNSLVQETNNIEPIVKKSLDLNDDDCVILDDDNSVKYKKNINENLTTIVIDDEYSDINIDYSFKGDVDEIIDIDSLIEENEAIIKKIDETKRFDSIIEVVDVPNSPSPGIQQIELDNNSVICESMRNYNGPSNTCHNSNSDILNNGNIATGQNSELTLLGDNIMSTSNSSRDTDLNAQTENRNSIGNIVADFFRRSQILNATNNVFTRIDHLINTLDSLLPNSTGESNSQPTLNNTLINDTDLSHEESPSTHLQTTSAIYNPDNPQPHRGSYATGYVVTTQQKKNKASKKSVIQKPNKNVSAGTDSVEKGTRNLGDCPICMDSLSNNAIASTICGHVFCLDCIKAAIRSSGKRCPTCRKALKGVGYHQLYL